MTTLVSSPLLRLVLRLDAIAAGSMGLALLVLAGPLSGMLGLPRPLLLGAGALLVPYAAVVAWMAGRSRLPAWSVWSVVALNTIWAVDSVLIVVAGFVSPTALGAAFVLVQAALVAAFAVVQTIAARGSEPAGAAA